MKKTWVKWVLLGLGVLAMAAFAIVGPIIIKAYYKNNSGCTTMWGAADVLSYYGSIVSAIIGILGVYFTVYAANKNYREDAKSKILPYIAINVINIRQPKPSKKRLSELDYSKMGNDPIIKHSLEGKTWNHLYFVIDGKTKIRVNESLPNNETEKIKETEVIWRRAKDGKMYIRDNVVVSMPLAMENVGAGAAKNLHMSLCRPNGKDFFKTELLLKPNERFYVHIFSEKGFEDIKGDYVFSVYYEDIAGNKYEQHFPIEIVEENGNIYKRITTNVKQECLV